MVISRCQDGSLRVINAETGKVEKVMDDEYFGESYDTL